jgi:predicted Zn finger-like uncharacterized protein
MSDEIEKRYCPHCGSEFRIDANSSFENLEEVVCSHCNKEVISYIVVDKYLDEHQLCGMSLLSVTKDKKGLSLKFSNGDSRFISSEYFETVIGSICVNVPEFSLVTSLSY